MRVNSEHTTGHAIDISRAALSGRIPAGLTLEQFVCLVELAGQRVGNASGGSAVFEGDFAGRGTRCDATGLPPSGPHVHVQDHPNRTM